MPEVGVEFLAEVPEITAVHLATKKKYPRSYPHGPGGTLCFSPRCLMLGEWYCFSG
jgi:hypothetical protein